MAQQQAGGTHSSEEPVHCRADAIANRDALARAAGALYAERGLDLPGEDIAHRAGLVRTALTPEDIRIQLLMLSAVVRPETPRPTSAARGAWPRPS